MCSDYDPADPTSLPKHPGYEAGLGTHDLTGMRVAVVPSLGGVLLDPGVEEHLRAQDQALITATGIFQRDLRVEVPNTTVHWMMGNMATLLADLGERWPACATDMTPDVALASTWRSRSPTCAPPRSPKRCA